MVLISCLEKEQMTLTVKWIFFISTPNLGPHSFFSQRVTRDTVMIWKTWKSRRIKFAPGKSLKSWGILLKEFKIIIFTYIYYLKQCFFQIKNPLRTSKLKNCRAKMSWKVREKYTFLTTLWTFISMCTSIVVFKEIIGHWTIRRTEASSM